MPITLAILNDYPLVVAGLRAVLDPYSDRIRVAELNVRTAVLSHVDLVLHDTYASEPGLVPVPRRATGPGGPKRVIYTWNSNAALVRTARDEGVDGYVLKSLTARNLVNTLERIHHGESLYPQADDHALTPMLGRWPGDEHGISGRESEVLALICQGLGNVEIAQRSYIGINTVKTYIRSAYRKIGVTTRPQAVIWGLSNGFGVSGENRTIYRP